MTWEIGLFSVSAAETKRCQRDDDPIPAYQREVCREGKDSSLHLFAPAVMRFPYFCWPVEGLTLPASFLAEHKDAENYLKVLYNNRRNSKDTSASVFIVWCMLRKFPFRRVWTRYISKWNILLLNLMLKRSLHTGCVSFCVQIILFSPKVLIWHKHFYANIKL